MKAFSYSDGLWTLCDHLGSVRDVLRCDDITVSLTNRLEYNAFGKLVSRTSAASTDTPLFRYTGKMTDDTTQLQWNINRWYDANVGKWISEDPIGFGGKDVNLYRYVRNNLLSKIDFLGLKQLTKTQENLLGAELLLCWLFNGLSGPPIGNIILRYFGNPKLTLVKMALDGILEQDEAIIKMNSSRNQLKGEISTKIISDGAIKKEAYKTFHKKSSIIFDNNPTTLLDFVLGTSDFYCDVTNIEHKGNNKYNVTVKWKLTDEIDANRGGRGLLDRKGASISYKVTVM